MEAPCFVLLGTMTDRVTQQYSGAAVTGSTWLCLCCCQVRAMLMTAEIVAKCVFGVV